MGISHDAVDAAPSLSTYARGVSLNANGIDGTMEILLVEDNPADIKITQRALRESAVPVELLVVRDGQEAVEYLRPRVLLVDPAHHVVVRVGDEVRFAPKRAPSLTPQRAEQSAAQRSDGTADPAGTAPLTPRALR